MNDMLPVGARVRILVDLPSAWPDDPDPDMSFGVKAGHLGTVTYIFTKFSTGYGVLLDNDPSGLSCYMSPDEIAPHETIEPTCGTIS